MYSVFSDENLLVELSELISHIYRRNDYPHTLISRTEIRAVGLGGGRLCGTPTRP